MLNAVKDSTILKEDYWPQDKKKVEVAIKNIIDYNNRNKHIFNLPFENRINSYKDYFLSGNFNGRCNFEKTLYISCKGYVKLCFNSNPVGNIKKLSLKKILSSRSTERRLNLLIKCGRSCGALLCQE